MIYMYLTSPTTLKKDLRMMDRNPSTTAGLRGCITKKFSVEVRAMPPFGGAPIAKHIAFLHFDDQPVPKFTLFRSAGAHGDLEINHYPKAGDPNPHVKFGVVDIQTEVVVWMEEKAEKDQYSALPFWTPDGEYLLFQEVNRGQDTLHLIKANPTTGAREVIYEETQSSWVEFYEEMSFFENGDFLLRSNKDGWYNLYRYDLDGNLVSQITDVPWRVLEIEEINEEAGKLFFYGTGSDPIDRHFFLSLTSTAVRSLN